jgi:5-methyltetrahydrofolate--homocysteine methyltransferase
MIKKFDHVVMLDGAMGTMLQRHGLKLREVPESLNVTRPELIESIHRAYFAAGSDYVQTNTFGANPFKLKGTGYDTEQVVTAAVKIARRAASAFHGKGVLLDIGPSGRAMAPVGDAGFDEIYSSVARQVKAGADQCDGVLIETHTDLLEAKAAVLAALENCDLPVFLTMSFQEDGRTFFGTSVKSMILTFAGMGLSGLGVNCSLGPAQIAPIVRTLTEKSPLPVIVQPNAGLPEVRDGRSVWNVTPDEYARWIRIYVDWGTAVVGGCCGTDPGYIEKASQLIADRTLHARKVAPLDGVCSASKAVSFEKHTVVIGERLNPTGKKRLKQALLEHDMDYLALEAQKQQAQGADVLDVNAGLPGTDETALLEQAVNEIQGAVTLPLQLDSSSPAALETAARHYAGKPILNSVSGKEASLNSVLPIAQKYGACVIGLTLDDSGIPETAEARFRIAAKIVERAVSLGIPKENILIDCLTLTASAQQDLVLETIRAVHMVHEKLRVKTVLGVSNVSFGLPRRPLVNRTMLAAALAAGLDAAIINPGEKNMQETIAAWKLLSGQDRDAEQYIRYCADHPDTQTAPAAAPAAAEGEQQNETGLAGAVIRGMKNEARRFAENELTKSAPMEIIEKTLIPALDAVGRDYESQKIYLPQLMKSADAAKSALEVIKAALAVDPGQKKACGPKVVIATVYGDVHDIGKNIVKIIMENYNFSVIDLGRDVPPEKVTTAVKESGAKVVGLSALMTTTVASMKDTIAALHRDCPGVRVIVGGAVLTADLAQSIGADSYAQNAMDTVRAAEKFTGQE